MPSNFAYSVNDIHKEKLQKQPNARIILNAILAASDYIVGYITN